MKLDPLVQDLKDKISKWMNSSQEKDVVPNPNQKNEAKKKKADQFLEDLSKQVNNIKNIKYIIVGDNPGNTELNEQKYFWGRTKHIRDFLTKLACEQEIIFWNKSFVSTARTVKLDKEKESQEIMAEFIVNLLRKNSSIKLWLLGKDFEKFSYFYQELEKGMPEKVNVCIFGHPSCNWFYKSFIESLPDEEIKKLVEKHFKDKRLPKIS